MAPTVHKPFFPPPLLHCAAVSPDLRSANPLARFPAPLRVYACADANYLPNGTNEAAGQPTGVCPGLTL